MENIIQQASTGYTYMNTSSPARPFVQVNNTSQAGGAHSHARGLGLEGVQRPEAVLDRLDLGLPLARQPEGQAVHLQQL